MSDRDAKPRITIRRRYEQMGRYETTGGMTMLETLGRMAGRLADYGIGTVIVLVHVTLADRHNRRRLLANN